MDSPPPTLDGEQGQRLLSVLEVTKEMAAERSFERLMALIVSRACESLNCERSSLFLYDQDTDELYTRWVTKLEIEEIRLPSTKGVVGVAVEKRQPVFVDDPYAHPKFDPSFDRATGFRTRNIVCMPLVSWSDGRLLGVLQLLNKHEGVFSTWERELLERVRRPRRHRGRAGHPGRTLPRQTEDRDRAGHGP